MPSRNATDIVQSIVLPTLKAGGDAQDVLFLRCVEEKQNA